MYLFTGVLAFPVLRSCIVAVEDVRLCWVFLDFKYGLIGDAARIGRAHAGLVVAAVVVEALRHGFLGEDLLKGRLMCGFELVGDVLSPGVVIFFLEGLLEDEVDSFWTFVPAASVLPRFDFKYGFRGEADVTGRPDGGGFASILEGAIRFDCSWIGGLGGKKAGIV